MEVDPTDEFAPIKSSEGEYSIHSAREKLREAHRKWV